MNTVRFTRSILLTALGLVLIAACTTPQAVLPVPGTLFFSQDANANGLYVLDMETGEATLVGDGITNVSGATVGLAGRGVDDPLVGSTWTTLHDIAQDGSGTTQFSAVDAEGLAYDRSTDVIYAIINANFRSVSPTTGTIIETLTSPGVDLEGLAADSDAGVIYAIGDTNLLYVYDIADDTWTEVGDTGFGWDQSGLAFDEVSGMLYAVGNDDNPGGLYTIDPATAAATLVGDTGLAMAEGGLAWVPGE